MRSAFARWRTVLAVHAGLTAAALVTVLPLGNLLDALVGGRPAGDLDLWRGGGALWVDLVMGNLRALRGALAAGGVLALGFLLLSPLATAAMVDAVASGREVRAPRLVELGRTAWSRLLVQRLALLAAWGLAGVLGAAGSRLAAGLVESWPSAPAAWAVRAAAFSPALLLGLLFASALDIAQAGVVLGRRGSVGPFLHASRWALRHPLRAVGPYLLALVAGLALTAGGASLATMWGGHAGFAALLLLVAHQLVAALRTFVRAGWLARAAALSVPALGPPARIPATAPGSLTAADGSTYASGSSLRGPGGQAT